MYDEIINAYYRLTSQSENESNQAQEREREREREREVVCVGILENNPK